MNWLRRKTFLIRLAIYKFMFQDIVDSCIDGGSPYEYDDDPFDPTNYNL